MYILSFIDDVNKFMKPIKNWLFNNYNNPFLWLGIVIGILAIFGVAYSLVHKD